VRGQLRMRIKLVQHDTKVDRGIARPRRLARSNGTKTSRVGGVSTTTSPPATSQHSSHVAVSSNAPVQMAGKSARKTRQRKRPPTKKIVHHKVDYSHVKSKTDSHHDRTAAQSEHLSRHEQLQEAQREYRRDRHRPDIISESAFPVVTHSIDLSDSVINESMRGGRRDDVESSYYDDRSGYLDDQDEWQGYDGELQRKENVGVGRHDMETLMKLYYQGGDDTAMATLPEGRLGLNDLMKLQSELESRDGFHDGKSSSFAAAARGGGTVLPHVLPQTLNDQDDDETYEQNVRALEREYQRLGGAST
jgi:hypothetical protein